MSDLPFTFKWVNATDSVFDPGTMNVADEDIFAFTLKHEEGQIPTLDITVRNPRVGLLAPGRKVWAWLGWQSEATDPDFHGDLVPLFFGVLVGVPTNLFQEKVKLQFIARSHEFIANKQAVAEAMKVQPYFDPLWFDTSRRDDPDSILEGWSALWHIDRTTLDITASDILLGEDGTVNFEEDIAFYDSVALNLGQPPLTNVRVEATCTWTQRSSGTFKVPTVNVITYTGETFISDWPKPGSGIGGGYSVESSFVNDIYRVALTPTTTYNSSWTNSDPNPGQCGNSAASSSSSGPALLSPNPLNALLTGEYKSGLCFPDSDPPINTPATTTVTGMIVPQWTIAADMTMRYDASRSFSEVLVFDMTADTQGILTSPQIAQDSELITISSIDLGKPLQNVLAWTDFAGHSVNQAQVIFPNNPSKPGGLSYQICVVAGTAGATEPVFSDFPGVVTNDNTVTWASLGESPLTDAAQWSPGSYVPVGQIINIQNMRFNDATGDYETIPGATSYYMCTGEGQTNGTYHTFSYTPTLTSNDDAPPAPRIISVIDPPEFSQTAGHHVTDGSVTWLVLGKNPPTLAIPIGGTPDNVTAHNFFPTSRGIRSVQFLISKARARLRMRSRAVHLSWSAPFRYGVGLSCRKNGTLFDPRLPGGAATGKIISYLLTCSGDGKMRTTVEIGCAVGFGNSIAEITGTPVYVNAGYVQHGYQRYEGRMIAHGSNDTTFSLPKPSRFDDGLNFPLSWKQISDGGTFSGDLETQKSKIMASFKATIELQYLQAWGSLNSFNQGLNTTTQSGISASQAWVVQDEGMAFLNQLTPAVMAANPISWSALIKPCNGNGPFEGAYSISVSPLVIPQGINLEAPSSP